MRRARAYPTRTVAVLRAGRPPVGVNVAVSVALPVSFAPRRGRTTTRTVPARLAVAEPVASVRAPRLSVTVRRPEPGTAAESLNPRRKVVALIFAGRVIV